MRRLAVFSLGVAVVALSAFAITVSACWRDFDSAFGSSEDGGDTAIDAGCPPAMTPNSAYERLVLAANPVAYYRFGETDGHFRSMVDGAPEGTSKPGDVLPTTVSAIHGDPNGAVLLTGGSIDFGLANAFDLVAEDKDFSLELWFRPDTITGADRILLSKEHNTGNEDTRKGFGLLLSPYDSGGGAIPVVIRFYRYTGSGRFADAGTLRNLQTPIESNGNYYRHVVVTHVTTPVAPHTNFRLFVDGRSKNGHSTAPSNAVTDASFLVGTDGDHLKPYKGRIDELAIYSRALSTDEILQHYQAAASSPCGAAEGALVCMGSDSLAHCTDGAPQFQEACPQGACIVTDGGAACGKASPCP